jgi:hypothetical protein
MKNAGTIRGVCAFAGLMIFLTMGALLDSADPPRGVWPLGGMGLVACCVIYKMAKE